MTRPKWFDEIVSRVIATKKLEGAPQMKPADFGLSMMDQAHRLRRHAVAVSRTTELDAKTCMWLVRNDHKYRLYDELSAADLVDVRGVNTVELLGLPVRFTVGDPPETPELQLVMEPVLRA